MQQLTQQLFILFRFFLIYVYYNIMMLLIVVGVFRRFKLLYGNKRIKFILLFNRTLYLFSKIYRRPNQRGSFVFIFKPNKRVFVFGFMKHTNIWNWMEKKILLNNVYNQLYIFRISTYNGISKIKVTIFL